MGLKNEIEKFCTKRLSVYEADPNQLIRDARIARRAAKDHVGRWFFELLQNCDDAIGKEVHVCLTEKAIYVADAGNGFVASAIEAISGTDFSDKYAGTIGRKGVGFKAVYDVSQKPQVFTIGGEGLEFCPEKAARLLKERGFKIDEESNVPYQWLPFFVSRVETEHKDLILRELADFSTVVRLPLLTDSYVRALEHLKNWASNGLITFRYIKKLWIEDQCGKLEAFEQEISKRDDRWVLDDSRNEPSVWSVLKIEKECPPRSARESLDADERKHVQEVEFLVAAPLDNQNVACPTKGYLPVHVFYPTEQKAPVRLLLHAEFLVKSDRTTLIPIESSPFNKWIAERLAKYIVDFVISRYKKKRPKAFLRLLLPMKNIEDHPVANYLWERIAHHARLSLLLPDIHGNRELLLEKAKILEVSVERDIARKIFEHLPSWKVNLVHQDLDNDDEARNTLKFLGCGGFSDDDIIRAIIDCSTDAQPREEWIWACWRWLASWIQDKPSWQSEHKERLEKIKKLPIVPIGGDLLSPDELAGKIVTWRTGEIRRAVPEWVPLKFIEDWFRERIESAEKDDHVLKLLKLTNVREPGKSTIIRGVEKAIDDYWQEKASNPQKFLDFLIQEEWDEELHKTSRMLARCPVLYRFEEKPDHEWIEAKYAYFGIEWGEVDLAKIYEGIVDVAWVVPSTNDLNIERRVLERLGVGSCPRVIHDTSDRSIKEEHSRLVQLLSNYTYIEEVTPPLVLEHLDLEKIDSHRIVRLIISIARNWEDYYKGFTDTSIRYFYYSSKSKYGNSLWWEQLLNKIVPPQIQTYASLASLKKCWLPDKRTRKAVGKFLPVIDIDEFGENKETVQKWLCDIIGVRRRLEELGIKEWKRILSETIPGAISEEDATTDLKKRNMIKDCYQAAIDSLENQEHIPSGVLNDIPLLCRKGNEWKYNKDEETWLADDNEVGNAFDSEIWSITFPLRLKETAKKYLGLLVLSEETEIVIKHGDIVADETEKCEQLLNEISPFIFTWRCHQTGENIEEKLKENYRSLKVCVVDRMNADLTLREIGTKSVKRTYGVQNSTLFFKSNIHGITPDILSRGISDFLGTKMEADFYENLFRCQDNAERKEKLLSKGVPEDEIKRLIAFYYEEPTEEIDVTGPISQNKGMPVAKKESIKKVDEPSSQEEAEKEDHEEEDKTSIPSDQKTDILKLKDPNEEEVIFIENNSNLGATILSKRGTGGHTSHGDMTQKEKDDIEDRGREFAEHSLKEMGYTVEQMPRDNPGFDIRATKDALELEIEIKAHLGESDIVEITARQIREYDENIIKSDENRLWELWNVENLSEKSKGQVQISRYNEIPKEALRDKDLYLDLRKCATKHEDGVCP